MKPIQGRNFVTQDILAPIEDSDIDSLFILPLNILPIETVLLQPARMIKNSHLQSVVEIFRDDQAGSGQLSVEALPQKFAWPEGCVHPDHALLRQLALLPSFDVYSLRIALRHCGIQVSDIDSLQLSERKRAELGQYMLAFTRPLVKMIFGNETTDITSFEGVIRLFQDPDVALARERLGNLARRLDVPVTEIPQFLEDYGDTFLSLSYFRHCLDRLAPYFGACIRALTMVRNSYQLKRDFNLMRSCDLIESVLGGLRSGISDRLAVIENHTRHLFNNMTQEEFRAVKALIERQHVTIGAILCNLTVKMNSFARTFPHDNAGGPVKRADFMQNEMIKGIDIMRRVARSG